jgi:NADH dehydrogenase
MPEQSAAPRPPFPEPKPRTAPTEEAPIVTLFGGSGFVGRYAAQRMARRGWRVKAAVRRPNDAAFVRTYGVMGQCVAVQANVRDDASCARALSRATAAVYSVGVLANAGANTFQAVQAEGPARVARLAKDAGVERFVLVSAIGADPDSPSEYARTKAEGERAVREHYPEAVILRPSIVFGPEDGFFNRFAGMAKIAPAVPVIGADTRFQPVYVDDVAAAVEKGCCGEAEPGVYELAGPRVASFRELIELMLRVIERKRWIVEIPRRVAMMQGAAFETLGRIGLTPPLTRDQVKQLGRDNVAAEGAKGLAELGIEPTAMEAVLESYLYAYRPGGRFADLAKDAPS